MRTTISEVVREICHSCRAEHLHQSFEDEVSEDPESLKLAKTGDEIIVAVDERNLDVAKLLLHGNEIGPGN